MADTEQDKLWNQAIEAAAREAEEWEGVETLLPLADAGANTAALVGQSEASERIAEAIRKLKRPADET